MCLPCTRISIAVLNFQGTDYFAISLFDRSKCGSKTTGTGRRVVFTNRVSTPKRRRHSKRLKKEQEINKELRLEINFFRDFCVLFNLALDFYPSFCFALILQMKLLTWRHFLCSRWRNFWNRIHVWKFYNSRDTWKQNNIGQKLAKRLYYVTARYYTCVIHLKEMQITASILIVQ